MSSATYWKAKTGGMIGSLGSGGGTTPQATTWGGGASPYGYNIGKKEVGFTKDPNDPYDVALGQGDTMSGLGSDLDLRNTLMADEQKQNWNTLNQILGMGYADQGTIGKAVNQFDSAKGILSDVRDRYTKMTDEGLYNDEEMGQMKGNWQSAWDSAKNLSTTGGYDAADWSAYRGQQQGAYDRANELTDTGGYSGNEFGSALNSISSLGNESGSALQEQIASLKNMRDNGVLSTAEFEQQVASAQQAVNDKYRAVQSNMYNNSLGNNGAGVFAAGAIAAQGASESGKAAAAERSNLLKYQADSKLSAASALNSTLESLSRNNQWMSDQTTGLYSDRAGNRVAANQNAVSAANGLAAALSSKADNAAEGAQLQSNLTGIFNQMITADAEGRQEALNSLASLIGEDADMAAQIANIYLTKTMPEYVSDTYSRVRGRTTNKSSNTGIREYR